VVEFLPLEDGGILCVRDLHHRLSHLVFLGVVILGEINQLWRRRRRRRRRWRRR
jgi:hypothetical protein